MKIKRLEFVIGLVLILSALFCGYSGYGTTSERYASFMSLDGGFDLTAEEAMQTYLKLIDKGYTQYVHEYTQAEEAYNNQRNKQKVLFGMALVIAIGGFALITKSLSDRKQM